jgi:hypothetical protein
MQKCSHDLISTEKTGHSSTYLSSQLRRKNKEEDCALGHCGKKKDPTLKVTRTDPLFLLASVAFQVSALVSLR